LNIITREAQQRLKAVEEFSELGSGFNIAMQDLDIRGSGNLLGAEQSGFIADVGFETYQRILDEAMHELRTGDIEGKVAEAKDEQEKSHGSDEKYITDCQIDTDMEIMFPDDYISNISERIRLYKELNNIESDEELFKFREKLTDRFGALPDPASQLLDLVRLRHLSCRLAIEKIVVRNETMVMHFISNPGSSFYKSSIFMKVIRAVSEDHRRFKVKQTESKLTVTAKNIKTIQQAINIFSSILETSSRE